MSKLVIGIDPGNCTGVAYVLDGILVEAYATDPDGRLTDTWCVPTMRAVVEFPRVYPGGRTRQANDLITLAITTGRWIERAYGLGCAVTRVEPRAWKGTAPKAVMGRRILASLSAPERKVIDALRLPPSKLHNVVDSVGLALWGAGRSVL